MNTKKLVLFGASGLVLAGALVYALGIYPPSSSRDGQGAIGKRDVYRAPQPADANVNPDAAPVATQANSKDVKTPELQNGQMKDGQINNGAHADQMMSNGVHMNQMMSNGVHTDQMMSNGVHMNQLNSNNLNNGVHMNQLNENKLNSGVRNTNQMNENKLNNGNLAK